MKPTELLQTNQRTYTTDQTIPITVTHDELLLLIESTLNHRITLISEANALCAKERLGECANLQAIYDRVEALGRRLELKLANLN